jgi:hypothetical protein
MLVEFDYRIDVVAEGRERLTGWVDRLVEQGAHLQVGGMKNVLNAVYGAYGKG